MYGTWVAKIQTLENFAYYQSVSTATKHQHK